MNDNEAVTPIPYTIIDRVVQYGNIGMGQTEENALAKKGTGWDMGHGWRPIDGKEGNRQLARNRQRSIKHIFFWTSCDNLLPQGHYTNLSCLHSTS